VDPPAGRVWTANARPIDDATVEAQIGGDEAALGAEYDLGARAKQIHDDLLAIPHATPLDMLKVQTDDNAVFLTRWRDLLIQLLDEATVRDHPRRAELRKLVTEWNARATPDAVGYRFVRTFRDQTERSVWRMLLVGLDVDAPDAPPPPQFEGALWELVTQRPAHHPEVVSGRGESSHKGVTLRWHAPNCPAAASCRQFVHHASNAAKAVSPLFGALKRTSAKAGQPPATMAHVMSARVLAAMPCIR
jgi:hypothetical protein